MSDARMPALFISHGAPTLPLEDVPARDFLRGLGEAMPKPRGVVAVSAHWETEAPTASAVTSPATIHDFSGFPEALYRLRYPAPGDPGLAHEVVRQLADAGIAAGASAERGLDHGAWVPLMLMYPQADVPVVQLSIQPHAGPEHHYRLGRALRGLRDDRVLVLASGSASHNLRALDPRRGAAPPAWVDEFVEWLAATAEAGDAEALIDYRRRAPHAVRNHPTDEHLLPLFVALGAGSEPRGKRLHHSYTYGAIAMDAYRFD